MQSAAPANNSRDVVNRWSRWLETSGNYWAWITWKWCRLRQERNWWRVLGWIPGGSCRHVTWFVEFCWNFLRLNHVIFFFCSWKWFVWFSGVFISSADNTIILATAGTISSELGSLENQSWLVVSYSFAVCAIQPAVCNLLNHCQIYIQFSFFWYWIERLILFGPNHLVWKTERYIWPQGRADRRLCIICHRYRLIVRYGTLAWWRNNGRHGRENANALVVASEERCGR